MKEENHEVNERDLIGSDVGNDVVRLANDSVGEDGKDEEGHEIYHERDEERALTREGVRVEPKKKSHT